DDERVPFFSHYNFHVWCLANSRTHVLVEYQVANKIHRWGEWSMTGRDPTPYEREYAGRKGLNALMDILSSRSGMNPTDTPLGRDETSD
ncbi:hypothetical protein GOP47_0005992, partial [Adiantum capillus-veneris]